MNPDSSLSRGSFQLLIIGSGRGARAGCTQDGEDTIHAQLARASANTPGCPPLERRQAPEHRAFPGPQGGVGLVGEVWQVYIAPPEEGKDSIIGYM